MSKRLLLISTAVCLAADRPLAAQRAFVGEWALIPSRSRMPDEMKVEHKGADTYAFNFGGGIETVVVDGTEQSALGGTLLAVKPAAPDTWIITRKQGNRLQLRATWELSSDQHTLMDHYREMGTDSSTLEVDYVYRRVGGGSGFAADWRSIRETITSPMRVSIKELPGGELSFFDPLAKRTKVLVLDGKEYSAKGEPAAHSGASYATRRVDARTLMITARYDGQMSNTEQLSVSKDSRMLTMKVNAAGHSEPIVLVFGRK